MNIYSSEYNIREKKESLEKKGYEWNYTDWRVIFHKVSSVLPGGLHSLLISLGWFIIFQQ